MSTSPWRSQWGLRQAQSLPQRSTRFAPGTSAALFLALLALAVAPAPCGAPSPPVRVTAARLTLNVPAFRAGANVMLKDLLDRVRTCVRPAWRGASPCSATRPPCAAMRRAPGDHAHACAQVAMAAPIRPVAGLCCITTHPLCLLLVRGKTRPTTCRHAAG